MKGIIHEIHRRSLWQVLGIYLAGSWIALQVVETLSESMTLPDWVQGFSVILLVLGLPIVLATAFVQEGVGKKSTYPRGGEGAGVAEANEDQPPAESPPADVPAPDTPVGGLFTWKRAILGGVGAAALLAAALGGWAVLRSMGIGPAGTLVAKGVLDDQATLVLTDFVAEDPSLSRAATEAFRVDLDQSNVIDLADPGYVTAVLARMQRDPDEPLDLDTGRELAVREGLPAIIGGEITRAGTGYVLTSQLLTSDSGEILVSDRETAADDTELISAIDRLSNKLRERIGESLGDLAAGPALESVTTADLEALRLYSRALQAGDEGNPEMEGEFLEEALLADSTFAMAWRRLGMAHISGGGRLGNRSRGIEALGRAYALRDRLTPRERELSIAGYFTYVEQDRRRAADAYQRMLEVDPNDSWALNNLALNVRGDGDLEQAEALQLRAMAVDSLSNTHHWNLSVTQAALGKYDEAATTLENWRRRVPGDAQPWMFSSALSAASRDFEEAERYALEGMEVRAGNVGDEQFSLDLRGRVAEAQGHLTDAAELGRQNEEAAASAFGPATALSIALVPAWTAIDVQRRPSEAPAVMAAALERYPIDSMGVFDIPWDELIVLYARTGNLAEARALLSRWESRDPEAPARSGYAMASAWIAIETGDSEGALRLLSDVTPDGGCQVCVPAVRAAAWSRRGDADSTIVALERYVEFTSMFRIFSDASVLAGSLETLGELYDEKGDLQQAANYYAQFVELWATADEELQPRVTAAQARLEEILREIG